MRLVFALIAVLLAFGLKANEPPQTVEEFARAELPSSGAPGVAWAIVDSGDVRAGAIGKPVAGGENVLSPDTPFVIGSISKSFTALAIMQLVEAGVLDLDAKIGGYLASFAQRPSGEITIRQLLSHTSGYSTVQGNSTHQDRDVTDVKLSAHVDAVALWEPAYRPGTRWEYSNTNYRVLGAVIEAASGMDYAGYVSERILEPIGMTNSFVSDGRDPGAVAVGHRPWFGGKRANRPGRTELVSAPAGGVFASANDLGRYLAMMLNGEDDVVRASTKSLMLQPASEVSSFYGLGWFLDAEAWTASHGGLVPGTETLATLVPAENKGVAVLVNANGGIGFGETLQLRNGITAIALGEDYSGEGSRLWQRTAYLSVVVLPFFFLLSIVVAWWGRETLRAKSGGFGLFSLWFPVIAMAAMTTVLLVVIPRAFGGSLATLLLYQPDFAWAMIAAAVSGPMWALFRLVVASPWKTTHV